MNIIKAGNKIFVVYGSIKELPIQRHKLMQSYLLQESGIGSTVSDIDARMEKAITLLQADKKDEAIEELSNFRYSVFAAIEKLDFKTMAFACLVNKVDGVPVTDLSSEGLSKVVGDIVSTGMSTEELEAHWDGVKKKLIPSLQPTSPDGLEITLSSLTT